MATYNGKKTLHDGTKNCWHVLSSSSGDYDGLLVSGGYTASDRTITVTSGTASLYTSSGRASYNYTATLYLIRVTEAPKAVATSSDNSNKHIAGDEKRVPAVKKVAAFENGKGSFTKDVVFEDLTCGTWYLAMYCGQTNGCDLGYTGFTTVSDPIIIYTDPGKPTITITDNGNNTYYTTVTKGASGSNNAATGFSAHHCYDDPTKCTNTFTSGNLQNLITNKKASRDYYVKAYTIGTYSNSDTVLKSASLKCYYAPPCVDTINKPLCTVGGVEKNKLLAKAPQGKECSWKWSWTKPKVTTGDHNDIKGYYIRLYVLKKGTSNYEPQIIKDSAGNKIKDSQEKLVTKTGKMDYWCRREGGNDTTLTIYPEQQGFKPGDQVKLGLYTYSRLGDKDKTIIYRGSGDWADVNGDATVTEIFSEEYLVENAGIVHLKTSSGWKEGQVYIKASDGWKEANCVYFKTSDGWKEST